MRLLLPAKRRWSFETHVAGVEPTAPSENTLNLAVLVDDLGFAVVEHALEALSADL